jgi:hypothetical protein
MKRDRIHNTLKPIYATLPQKTPAASLVHPSARMLPIPYTFYHDPGFHPFLFLDRDGEDTASPIAPPLCPMRNPRRAARQTPAPHALPQTSSSHRIGTYTLSPADPSLYDKVAENLAHHAAAIRDGVARALFFCLWLSAYYYCTRGAKTRV